MIYRTLPHGGERLSVIGMGAGSLHNSSAKEIERTVDAAIDAGVNLFDYIPSNAAPLEPMARALHRHRADVNIQMHMGADYSSGSYGWTTNAKTAIREFENRLRTVGTDYADFGFIHCIDEDADLDHVLNGGIWEYALKRKADGTIRHLACSTHSTHIARRLAATGEIDLCMFGINPMYDYTDDSSYGSDEADDRMALYREFESAGIGISVMKPFAGGQLLSAAASPFGRALSRTQCLQYALDRPAVVSILPGMRGMSDLQDILIYLDATDEERDYSAVAQFRPENADAPCMYCNHCQPCPAGIAIGMANKYYDLARQGDVIAAGHYRNLEKHASDCINCGHCDSRCPFDVAQSARMKEIAAYFGI